MATCELTDENRVSVWALDDKYSYELHNPEVIGVNDDSLDFVWFGGWVDKLPQKEQRIEELQTSLAETDYFASQALENLFDAIGQIEPLDLFASLKLLKAIVQWNIETLAKYGDMIAKRRAWRAEIQQIENKNQDRY